VGEGGERWGCSKVEEFELKPILVPRGCAPLGQHQEWPPLAGSNIGSLIHRLPVTLHMLRVKSDKSDWFRSHSIVFAKPIRTGISLDLSRGHDSWCWP